MKSIRKLNPLVIFAALVIGLGLIPACDGLFPPQEEDPVSADERLTLFMAELNTATRENIYKHFHPSDTEMYNQIKAADFFNTGPLAPSNGPFTLNLAATLTDEIGGRKKGSGTLTNDIGTSFDLIVVLYPVGEVWYIEELLLNDEGTIALDIKLGG